MKIGLRLGLGFGMILLAASVMLVGSLVSNGVNRAALLETLHNAAAQQDVAQEMNLALLKSAVAVRNMGLQTKVEGVQKDEAEAKKQRAAYLAAKGKLEAAGLGAQERDMFAKLTDIDKQMDAQFKEAVDLAAQFNTEQAGVIITGKIDPLLTQAMTELASFISLQKQHSDEATARTNASNQTTVMVISVAGLVVLGFAALMAWSLTVSITRPLHNALNATSRVAQGDLSSDIHVDDIHSQEETERLLTGLLEMRNGLARIVNEVRAGAENISTGANEIAAGNADLSHRTETQASNLEETAASMEELSSTVKSNADTARQANQMAGLASSAAVQGGVVMGQVISTMQDITVASRKIADIISVIDGIAFQTNILALNAAVEAARAGEQGRGFAVVASEVRSLAGRSAEAAKEIKNLIGASVAKVEAGSQLVGEAGTSMNDIVTQVKRVAELIAEISSTAHEQTSGIDQINQAITQLDNVTQQNAALVEQAAAAADSLNQQAGRMVEVVSVFKLANGTTPVALQRVTQTQRTAPRQPALPKKKTPELRLKTTKAPTVSASAPKQIAASRPTASAAAESDWETF
jgi:methyl-accepting chemotaxis protein